MVYNFFFIHGLRFLVRSNEHVRYCSETEIVRLSSITTLSFRISKRELFW